MKKIMTFFVAFVCMMPCASWSAINVKSSGIKKAAPVATKQENKIESATSLLPTVIGLVQGVQNLNKQQQQLSEDCAPTSSELQLVNDLVKEWAKTGSAIATVARGTGVKTCRDGSTDNTDFKFRSGLDISNNESGYESFINNADSDESCVESFSTQNSQNTIWEGFPKASSGKKCENGNSKKCKYITNAYDIFAAIPFGDEDYTKSEAAKIAQFKAKAERCSTAKLNAAKRELYGSFLTQTLGGIGKSSGAAGTSSVIEAVTSMGGGSNVQSVLPSLGSMATQMFDK